MPARKSEIVLEVVGPEELPACGVGCVADRRHEGHGPKVAWLTKRFGEGLRFFLFRDTSGRPLAFLEYVPGEHAWRPVDAKGWLFVHCLWVYPRGKALGGLGRRLIAAVVEEARRSGRLGVAALVSDGPWMVGRQLFLESGFVEIAERDRFQLVVHRLKKGPGPRFRDLDRRWSRSKGLHIVFAPQCPYLPKSVADVSTMAREHGLPVTVTELRSAREAQAAPSYYGVFGLLWNGQLLADHYVSRGRFRNLLKNEILHQGR